jgi:phenylpyruvate tautomerase PptA (4-oxalocrotonate tautomerase family)/limonene-1,2-epoxide hydrolase
MPVVSVTMMQGYDAETREALMRRLTRAVRATIAAPLDGTTILINEVAPSSYMRGGMSGRKPGAAVPDTIGVVRAFLAAMEARDLDKAATFLAPEFAMTFPGGARFTRLADLVATAKTRYRSVHKVFDGFDEAAGDDATVVFCRGTLTGEWTDGTPFAGIRFIDRFTVRGSKLVDQMVWNDLAEARSSRGRDAPASAAAAK